MSRIIRSCVQAPTVFIGERHLDFELEDTAEKQLARLFPVVSIITDVDGAKLIPIQEVFKIEKALNEELGRAREAARRSGAAGVEALVGLNCRDLRSLEVRPDRFRELARAFPGGVRRVAESGIQDAGDAAEVAACGFDLALVGTALMRQTDPGTLITAMPAAGRAARSAA